MKKLTNAVRAANTVYECGGEIYHLEALRLEKGDKYVLNHLAGHYEEKDGLSVPDSHIRAGQFINDIDALKAGGFDFKGVRERIAESDKSRVGDANGGFTFIRV
jgi:hypothetical protein